MDQVHKRLTTEQVKVLLEGYRRGLLDGSAIEEVLGIGRSRFFVLLKEYRQDPAGFSVNYHRESRPRLPVSAEAEIEKELENGTLLGQRVMGTWACSTTGKAVNYHSKEGVSHGATDYRPVLAS